MPRLPQPDFVHSLEKTRRLLYTAYFPQLAGEDPRRGNLPSCRGDQQRNGGQVIKASPFAIDLYIWLTYRMSYLKTPTLIPWEGLQAQ